MSEKMKLKKPKSLSLALNLTSDEQAVLDIKKKVKPKLKLGNLQLSIPSGISSSSVRSDLTTISVPSGVSSEGKTDFSSDLVSDISSDTFTDLSESDSFSDNTVGVLKEDEIYNDISKKYNIDLTKRVGDDSSFKIGYIGTKLGKKYIIFTFSTDVDYKEVDIFRKIIKDKNCSAHAICPVEIGFIIQNGEKKLALVADFITGKTLNALLKLDDDDFGETQYKNISLESALNLMLKMAKSCKFIHNEWEFVHLDIKPDNIMVDEDLENAYIIDLGSGCFKSDEECRGMKTEHFGAPEVSSPPDDDYWKSGDFADWKKSDIYSLGRIYDFLLSLVSDKDEHPEQSQQLEKLVYDMTGFQASSDIQDFLDNLPLVNSTYENIRKRPDIELVISSLKNIIKKDDKEKIHQIGSAFFSNPRLH
jgi:hypothetical protein